MAAGLLATFVGLYLTLLWVQSDPNRGLQTQGGPVGAAGAIALTCSLAYHQSWPFLFFFLSVAVAFTLPANLAVFGIIGVTVVDAVVVTRPRRGNHIGPPDFRGVHGGADGHVHPRMMRLISDLNAAREDLARLAVADERLRFARDLHDLLGHTLSLIVVKSEAVRRLVGHDVEAAVRESGDIEMVSRQALAEVREAVTNYRDRSLDAELEGARMTLAAAGIEATIHRPPSDCPTPSRACWVGPCARGSPTSCATATGAIAPSTFAMTTGWRCWRSVTTAPARPASG